eukprot:4440408-Pleurochrysis_carterae.AAC.2
MRPFIAQVGATTLNSGAHAMLAVTTTLQAAPATATLPLPASSSPHHSRFTPRRAALTAAMRRLARRTLARLRCFSLVGAGAEADDGDDADDADADAAAAAAAADDDDDDGDDKEEDDDRGGRVDFDTDATDDGDLESDARDGGGGDAALTLKADGGDEAGCSRLGPGTHFNQRAQVS